MDASLASDQLALALEAALLGTWRWDRASGVTTWNPRLEELHGLAPGEFDGTFEGWISTLDPRDRAECVARVEAALELPGPYALLHRTVWADGSLHWIECRGQVLVDEHGQATGTVGVAFDVTERAQREAAAARELAEERGIVETLQRALLPRVLPTVPGVTVATRYVGAAGDTVVGGDWYAVVPVPGDRLGIAVGDVAGHGLAAIAEMADARFSLRALAVGESRPELVLERLNDVVCMFDPDAMVTALYGIVDPARRRWSFANAGHYPPVLREPGSASRLLEGPGEPPLGMPSHYRRRDFDLAPGATLVLYTDGLVERRGILVTRGLDRLLAVCDAGPDGPDDLCEWLVTEMLEQTNVDDVAVVVLSVR